MTRDPSKSEILGLKPGAAVPTALAQLLIPSVPVKEIEGVKSKE